MTGLTGRAQMTASLDSLPPHGQGIETRWHALPVAEVEGLGLAAGAGALSGVPGALHILSARELKRFGYTDPMRTLRNVSGLQLQEEDGWGLRPNIGIRGSGSERSTRISIVEDGVLVAPAAYASPAAYYFPSIARMSQVEVLKGSGQIAFGPRTAGGALSLTSTPIPDAPVGGQLRMEGASWRGRLVHASAGGTTKTLRGSWGYLVEHLGWSSEGFKALPDGSPTGFDKQDAVVKLEWRAPERARWEQTVGFKWVYAEEQSHETYLGLTDADFDRHPFQRYAATQKDLMKTEWQQAGLHHLIQGWAPRGRWTLHTDLYATAFERNWYRLDRMVDSTGSTVALSEMLASPAAHPQLWNVLRGATGDGAEGMDLRANARTFFSRGVQTRFTHIWKDAQGVEQRWMAGLRWHTDGMDRFEWRDRYRMEDGNMVLEAAGVPGSAANAWTTAHAASGWIRLNWTRGAWVFTPGFRTEWIVFEQLRFDSADTQREGEGIALENRVVVGLPGLGVHRELGDWGAVFGGVHRGFIPPGVQPGSKPEFSTQGELGIRASGAGWAFQAVAFGSQFSDLLGADLSVVGGTGSGDLFNGGAAWTHGLELEAAWDPLHGMDRDARLPIRATYGWVFSQFTESFDSDFDAWGNVQAGDLMPYIAPHQASCVVAWELPRWSLDLSGRYVSAMRTVAGQGDLEAGLFTPAATIWDAGFRMQPTPALGLRLGVQNLFDEIYLVARRPFGARPGLPRMVRLGVTFSF
jgi:Fe(3+) dicitrate transport protein